MNMAQKAVLGIGVAAIALMGIFPPWSYTYILTGVVHSTRPAGYAPIYRPPIPYRAMVSPPAQAQTGDIFDRISPQQPAPPKQTEPDPLYTTSIDVSRLLVQWAIAAAVTGGLVLILRSNAGNASTNGPAKTNRNDPALQNRPESAAGPAYPPIWSQGHTLPDPKRKED
jgi:hypothetical protein